MRDSLLSRWTGRARLAWERTRSNLWFIPTVLVLAAFVLSTVLLEVDRHIGPDLGLHFWLFRGNAEGARTVLSVIAGSLITVLAVAFSGTMIAIQQASTQYTPRVLRNFTKDRGNQWVLGTYIGTFAYALLVLRRVRGNSGDLEQLVPSISISMGMLLALLSLGFLIYFIHHVAESLQVTYLLSSIRGELDDELRRLLPERTQEPFADSKPDPTELDAPDHTRETVLRIEDEGYLRIIDHALLARTAEDRLRLLRIEVGIGEYLRRGDVIARAYTTDAPDEHLHDEVRAAFQVDRDRSIRQDPLFGIRQIVDIAVKALSPGVHDPTTAEQALDHLGGAVSLLLRHLDPSPWHPHDGHARIWSKKPTFADYVNRCFAQIRRAARNNLDVTLYLIDILSDLIERAGTEERRAVLRAEIEDVVAGFELDTLCKPDRARLANAWRQALQRGATERTRDGTVSRRSHAAAKR